jgi:hypothetical protein
MDMPRTMTTTKSCRYVLRPYEFLTDIDKKSHVNHHFCCYQELPRLPLPSSNKQRCC